MTDLRRKETKTKVRKRKLALAEVQQWCRENGYVLLVPGNFVMAPNTGAAVQPAIRISCIHGVDSMSACGVCAMQEAARRYVP